MILQRLFKKATESYFDLRDKLENLAKGYGFIPTSYYADPKKEIAHKVLPILKSYQKLIFKEENMSLPTWVVSKENSDNFTDTQLNQIWLGHLNKMILAYELVLAGVHSIEDEIKIDEGLVLFSTYYQHLWD
ncbi:hypothetical protein [Acinetobacter junii]|uniref:hypothetical protein n=1 Tax=Acinetobacter junii TaxID=40215 RepID=UPI000FA59A72|nr:hypothetical protein [Acinetobacter junii]RSE32070.1 hypothetical protein EGT62_11950 [Acinetobacter junii]